MYGVCVCCCRLALDPRGRPQAELVCSCRLPATVGMDSSAWKCTCVDPCAGILLCQVTGWHHNAPSGDTQRVVLTLPYGSLPWHTGLNASKHERQAGKHYQPMVWSLMLADVSRCKQQQQPTHPCTALHVGADHAAHGPSEGPLATLRQARRAARAHGQDSSWEPSGGALTAATKQQQLVAAYGQPPGTASVQDKVCGGRGGGGHSKGLQAHATCHCGFCCSRCTRAHDV
jgi:hypothetical protein